jgi:hypothetical protein
LSWAENRNAVRGEDKAYSLLRTFDVYMPLFMAKRFSRLRENIDKPSKGKHTALDIPRSSRNGR